MKIAFFELEDWEIPYIKKSLKEYDTRFFKEPLSKELCKKLRDIEIIGIFIYSKIDKAILDKLPKLRLIATMSTGFDHIDIKECVRRKISVSNVPFYGENTVAEHTFALILALTRKLYPSILRTKNGLFDINGLRGFDLKDKTLGLIGTGHIAGHVARIAQGFEMKILGYDKFKNDKITKTGLKYVGLNELLKRSDIISLHLPLNNETKHIINKKNIKLIKSHAMIINTARGGLIDTHALGHALLSGKIGGAALDVLEEEAWIKHEDELLRQQFRKPCDIRALVEYHVMSRLDNVIITPHNAFNSQEAIQRIIDTTINNISSYNKKRPINIVKT